MQHHLGTDLFKGGVYDQSEMVVETFSRSEKRRLEPLEGKAGCMKLGMSRASGITRFEVCCRAGASLPSLVTARG